MSNIYKDDFKKSLSLKRDFYVLRSLLVNIKTEEPEAIKFVKKYNYNIPTIDFNDSFIVTSEHQIYRSISVVGIMKNFNKSVKYRVMDLALLVDIWYNQSNIFSKSELSDIDILIIHGKPFKKSAEQRTECLSELIGIRKTRNKKTWMFIETKDPNEFKTYYPGIVEYFNQQYIPFQNL